MDPAFLAAIVEHVAHPIFVKDRQFRFVLVNRALCDLVGIERERLLGRTDYDFFPRAQADFFRAKDEELFASARRVVVDEEPITDAAGAVHVLATTKVPLLGADGAPTHLLGIIHDITALKAAEHELQRKNEELAREVAERERAYARLEELHRELEAFSYAVSHDLRAPLRSIDGFSKAVLEEQGDRLDEQGRADLRRVRDAAQRMGLLIDDILWLSRVTRAELRIERVDLAAIARDVVGRLREAEPERMVEVAIADGLLVDGDEPLLSVALENLLSNAWKFTGRTAGARIELGVRDEGDERVYYVQDNGAGFDMQYAGKLFQPFARLHRPEDFPGTGVGLATVQRVVQRHGGRIWAEAAPGRGATFSFTLAPPP